MALTLNVNTWVTVAQADAFFLLKYKADAWATLSNTVKEQLLASAYRWINRLYILSISTVTQKIKDAQCETAWYLYKFNDEHEKRAALYNQGVTDFRIQDFSETLKDAQFPDYIFELLKDSIVNGSSGMISIDRDL